ncbi:MAG: hypothetical protein GWP10_05260 [Nitrospiraceae bacterium]|nr:hypothetical protein [Nitrospiraceae bacterium]
MLQSNSVAIALNETWKVPPLLTGIVLALLTAVVIIGGIRRIGKVRERLVPIMGIFYVLGSVAILVTSQ